MLSKTQSKSKSTLKLSYSCIVFTLDHPVPAITVHEFNSFMIQKYNKNIVSTVKEIIKFEALIKKTTESNTRN